MSIFRVYVKKMEGIIKYYPHDACDRSDRSDLPFFFYRWLVTRDWLGAFGIIVTTPTRRSWWEYMVVSPNVDKICEHIPDILWIWFDMMCFFFDVQTGLDIWVCHGVSQNRVKHGKTPHSLGNFHKEILVLNHEILGNLLVVGTQLILASKCGQSIDKHVGKVSIWLMLFDIPFLSEILFVDIF